MKQKTYNSILALIAAVVCSAAVYAEDIIVEPYLPPPYPGPPMSEWQWNLYHSVNWAVEQALRQQESSITNLNSIQESITSLDSRIAGIEGQVPPQITISRTAETDLGTRVNNTRTDIASLNSLLSQKADISQLHPPVDFRSGDGISLSAWDFGSSPGVAVMTISLSSNAIDSAVSITNGPLITIESAAATTSAPPSFTIGVDETALAAMFPVVDGGTNGTLLTVTSTEATTNEPMTYTVELDEEALAAMFPVVRDGSNTLLSVVQSGGAGGTATTYTVDIDESALTGWIVTQTWYESWLTDWNDGVPTYDARYLMLDASNDPLTGTLTAQNIEPSANETYNLGSQQARWATTFTKDLVVTHLQPEAGDGEDITIDGDLVPVSSSFSLGSVNNPWGHIYVNDAHIDGSTLYVGGVPIRSDGTNIMMPALSVSNMTFTGVMKSTLNMGTNRIDGQRFGEGAGEGASGINWIAIGYDAGIFSSGTNWTAAGIQAGSSASGDRWTACGNLAGQASNGYGWGAYGYQAGSSANGDLWTAVGYLAGFDVSGDSWDAYGHGAGNQAVGDEWGAYGRYTGVYAVHTNSHAGGIYAGRTARGNNRMYLDVYSSDPVYAADGPTNDTIFLDSDGHLYLGGGPARAENPSAGVTLRGDVTIANITPSPSGTLIVDGGANITSNLIVQGTTPASANGGAIYTAGGIFAFDGVYGVRSAAAQAGYFTGGLNQYVRLGTGSNALEVTGLSEFYGDGLFNGHVGVWTGNYWHNNVAGVTGVGFSGGILTSNSPTFSNLTASAFIQAGTNLMTEIIYNRDRASWAEPLSTTNDAPAAAAPRFLGDEFFYHNGTNRAIYRAFGTTTNDWVEVWRQ